MAPRTREQQDEYNRKRREQNALARADKAKPEAEPKPKGRHKKQGPIPIRAAPPKASSKKGNGRSRADVHISKHTPVSTSVALSKRAPVIQQGAPREHTMARSYVRTSGAGTGKLRAGTYQATVSFTKDQRDRLIAAAGFRCVSLAEMIRSCVVEHLTKNLSS